MLLVRRAFHNSLWLALLIAELGDSFIYLATGVQNRTNYTLILYIKNLDTPNCGCITAMKHQASVLTATIILLAGLLYPTPNASAADEHREYVRLYWPHEGSYNFDLDLTITDAPSSAKILYWFHEFEFVGGEVGYIGLQVVDSKHKALFSIWDATGASPP